MLPFSRQQWKGFHTAPHPYPSALSAIGRCTTNLPLVQPHHHKMLKELLDLHPHIHGIRIPVQVAPAPTWCGSERQQEEPRIKSYQLGEVHKNNLPRSWGCRCTHQRGLKSSPSNRKNSAASRSTLRCTTEGTSTKGILLDQTASKRLCSQTIQQKKMRSQKMRSIKAGFHWQNTLPLSK